jgi:hypothetical protein
MNSAPQDDELQACAVTWRSRSRAAGFTFAELLIVVSIAAAVLIAGVIALQALGQFNLQRSSYEPITLTTSVMTNFYGAGASNVSTWSAPMYGHLARVETLRDQYYEDLQKSVAVYCLPRTNRSNLRTSTLPINSAYAVGTFDFRRLSTPELFRQFLTNSVTSTASTFTVNAYTAESGSARACNLSVLMLSKPSRANLNLYCQYEIDFVRPTSPSGVYASVRRYEGSTVTHYYDVFYPDVTGSAAQNWDYFYVAACFNRAGAPTNGSAANVADGQPFYFVWFPDPATRRLPAASIGYMNAMRDQTSLLFVTPMFPSL